MRRNASLNNHRGSVLSLAQVQSASLTFDLSTLSQSLGVNHPHNYCLASLNLSSPTLPLSISASSFQRQETVPSHCLHQSNPSFHNVCLSFSMSLSPPLSPSLQVSLPLSPSPSLSPFTTWISPQGSLGVCVLALRL